MRASILRRLVQQQLAELKGKPYSRMAIDLFLTEQVRPIYQKQGFLRAKLGPPEIRLTGNPNQKLPEQDSRVRSDYRPARSTTGRAWSGPAIPCSRRSRSTGDLGARSRRCCRWNGHRSGPRTTFAKSTRTSVISKRRSIPSPTTTIKRTRSPTRVRIDEGGRTNLAR